MRTPLTGRFTQSEGSITVWSAGPDVASDSQRLVGSLDVPGTLVINEAIGGCDGLYGPSDCPTIVGDIEMSGSFELANEAHPLSRAVDANRLAITRSPRAPAHSAGMRGRWLHLLF